MKRWLSPNDLDRLTLKFKILRIKMKKDATLFDWTVLTWLDEAIQTRKLPYERIESIRSLMDRYDVE